MVEPDKAQQNILLVLADVDGTLVTKDKILTERAQQAVKNLHAAGIKFAVTSGRPPKGMEMLIEPLSITSPLAGFNGGMLVQPDMQLIEEKTLDVEVVKKAIALMKSHKVDVWIYRNNDWYVSERHAPHVDREEFTVRFPPQVVTDMSALTDHVVKIVGVSDDTNIMKKCESDLQSQLGKTASAACSQPYYVDVTHPDANKGFVVNTLAKYFSIDKKSIVTIGDMPNDVLMFTEGGISIAMGNASDEVKGKATYVTDSFEDEGFAKAMERFVLKSAVRS
jgi:Cof subfamily protein (haloacid dehalogenase superfamily)